MQDTVQQIQKLCEDAIGLFSTLSKRAGELSSQLQTQVDIERLQRLQRVDEEAERYKQRLCEKAEQDMAKLEEQRRRLHAEVEELQRLKQPWKSGRVRLDVGGKTFTTSQSTLTRFPDSLLGKMFSGRHPLDQDEEGRVFLDRDGKLFAYVLDFLRDEAPQQQWQPPADPQLQQKVLREFQYFGIPFPSSSSTAPSPSTSTTTTSSSAPSTASTGSEGLARALQPPDKRRSLSLLNPLSFLSLGSSFSSAAPTTLSPTTNPPPIATAGSAAVTPSFAFSSSFLSGSTTTSSASSCPTSPSSSPLMRHVKTNTPYTLNVNGSMPARSSSVGGAISGSHSKATHTRKSLPPGGSLPNLSSVEADAAEEIFTGKLEGHTDAVMALAVIDGGRNIITASSDGVCRLYDLATGRCLKTMQGHTDWLSAVAVSKDGTRAISGSWDLTAKVWDLTTTTKDEKVGAATSSERARCLGTLTGHTSWVMAVALSADGKSALTGSRDWTAKLWLLDEGATPSTSAAKGDEVEKTITCHQTLRGHSDTVSGVCFLEEDNSNAEAASAKKSVRKVVTASFDQTCRLWDVYSGLCLCILSGHEDVIYGLSLIPTARENTHENGSRKFTDITTRTTKRDE
ncbi:BTB/POZ domain-containing protein kctd14 [Balamuthia mandrillaris]